MLLAGIIIIILLISVLFLALPIIVAISMSFDARGYLGPFPPPAYSLRWYGKFFDESYFIDGLKTSLLVSSIAALITSVVGVAAAVALDRSKFIGKNALISFFLSPLIVPAVVIGFSLLVFLSHLGFYDGFIRLICGHTVIAAPYVIRTTFTGLSGIRKSFVEAAMNLGATELQAFWAITFPLAKTGIIAGAVFAFAFSLDDVAVSIFLSDPNSYTLPVALVSMMRANFDLTIAAASVLFMGVTLLVVFVLDRLLGLDQVIGQGMYRS
jgi:putative spermidine/putrescine transport system permease protein